MLQNIMCPSVRLWASQEGRKEGTGPLSLSRLSQKSSAFDAIMCYMSNELFLPFPFLRTRSKTWALGVAELSEEAEKNLHDWEENVSDAETGKKYFVFGSMR